MFATIVRHKLPVETAERWARHIPEIKKLPNHVKQKAKSASAQPLPSPGLGPKPVALPPAASLPPPAAANTAAPGRFGWKGVPMPVLPRPPQPAASLQQNAGLGKVGGSSCASAALASLGDLANFVASGAEKAVIA